MSSVAPAVTAPTPPLEPPTEYLGYRVPPLGHRIIISGLYLVPSIVLLVGLPVAALGYLQTHSVALPIPIGTVTVFGFVLSILFAVRYVAKPTRLYGPMTMVTSGVGLLYLWLLYTQSTYTFSIPNATASIGLTYADLVALLMVVPVLKIVSGAVTTVEDLRAPTERLPYDFPA